MRLRLRIMQSNGGSLSATSAGRNAVRTVLSGPAGGVAGAFAAAEADGFPQAITFDMGGTSGRCRAVPWSAVGAHRPGGRRYADPHARCRPAYGSARAAARSRGSIRAGRCESVHSRRALILGLPHTAGGRLPTVTDAHTVLGRLRPEQQLGGTVPLDVKRAEAAIATIADPFGSVEAAAQAVIDVVNANMARALRVISVERGLRSGELYAGRLRRRGAAARLRPGRCRRYPASADSVRARRAFGWGDADFGHHARRRAGAASDGRA